MLITKVYSDYPAAHRQHLHDGHCATIHGHNWSFEFVFESDTLDDSDFVLDFGKMGALKENLSYLFDHTILLSQNDPLVIKIQDFLHSIGQNNVRVVPGVTAEALAKFLGTSLVPSFLRNNKEKPNLSSWKRGVRIVSVTVHEDSKNSATWKNGNS